MLRNLAINALLVIIIAQCALVTSLPTSPGTTPEDENSAVTLPVTKAPVGHAALKLLAFGNFTESYNFNLRRTRKIAKDVLADESIANVNTDDMIAERRILTDYVETAKTALETVLSPGEHTDDERFDLVADKAVKVVDFLTFARRQNVTEAPADASETKQLLWGALLQHGWVEYNEEERHYLDAFYPLFAEDVLKYVNSLTLAGRQLDEKLVWMCEYYEQHLEKITKAKLGKEAYHLILDEGPREETV